MSIVELSATVDKLAKIINQKNKELEELKRGYDQKLHVINQYIQTLEDGIQDSNSNIGDEDFVNQISSKIECPNCTQVVWNNTSGDYILLPKHQLKYLIQETTPTSTPIEPSSSATTINPRKHKNKSRITCSFCGESGHTRAKCFKRLATPIKDGPNP